jgi:hypothetical protein
MNRAADSRVVPLRRPPLRRRPAAVPVPGNDNMVKPGYARRRRTTWTLAAALLSMLGG